MSTFKKILYYRLLAEALALRHKITDLDDLRKSADYPTLSTSHRLDVNTQKGAMQRYLSTLQSRIEDLGKEIDE